MLFPEFTSAWRVQFRVSKHRQAQVYVHLQELPARLGGLTIAGWSLKHGGYGIGVQQGEVGVVVGAELLLPATEEAKLLNWGLAAVSPLFFCIAAC